MLTMKTSRNNNTDCQRSIPSLLSRSLGTVCVRKVYQKHLLTVRSVGSVTFSMSTVWGWALYISAHQWCSRLAAMIFTQMVRVWILALSYVHYGKKNHICLFLYFDIYEPITLFIFFNRGISVILTLQTTPDSYSATAGIGIWLSEWVSPVLPHYHLWFTA